MENTIILPEFISGIPTAKRLSGERIVLIRKYYSNLWKRLQREKGKYTARLRGSDGCSGAPINRVSREKGHKKRPLGQNYSKNHYLCNLIYQRLCYQQTLKL